MAAPSAVGKMSSIRPDGPVAGDLFRYHVVQTQPFDHQPFRAQFDEVMCQPVILGPDGAFCHFAVPQRIGVF